MLRCGAQFFGMFAEVPVEWSFCGDEQVQFCQFKHAGGEHFVSVPACSFLQMT